MNNSNTNEAEQTQSVQPFLRVQVCGGDYIPMLVSICSPLDCCEGWELSGGSVWICKDGFSVTPLLFLAHVRTVEKQSCAALSPGNSNQSMSLQRVASLNTGQDTFICRAAYFSAWCSQLIAHPSRCCSPFSSRHVSYARTHAHKPGNTMQVPTGIWLPNKTTIHRSDQCFQGCSSSRLRKMGDNAAQESELLTREQEGLVNVSWEGKGKVKRKGMKSVCSITCQLRAKILIISIQVLQDPQDPDNEQVNLYEKQLELPLLLQNNRPPLFSTWLLALLS